ncbi:hypothetical protein BJ944DRAFT_259963 [Cunninghamella echinulata]|nr:hypothetical protein BJ944DRAFT_259963 [Cunninghamella echinulata]
MPKVIRETSNSPYAIEEIHHDDNNNKENTNLDITDAESSEKKRSKKDIVKYFESITSPSPQPECFIVDISKHDTSVEYNAEFILAHFNSNFNERSLNKSNNNIVIESNYRSLWDWDTNVKKIEEVIYNNAKGTSRGILFYYVKWFDGVLSVHEASEVSSRCPQKLVAFYEERLLKEVSKEV